MKVFVVFKEGVYRHECAGVFSKADTATRIADERLAGGDHYHQWTVVPFELDVPVPVPFGDALEEPDEIYRAGDGKRVP